MWCYQWHVLHHTQHKDARFHDIFLKKKFIPKCFQIYENKGDAEIVYYMIIGRDIMVQLRMIDNWMKNFLKWDDAVVSMK